MDGNIILIGMPGAGKSTVGVVIAKTLGFDFIDTDIVLGCRIGGTLQDYINMQGLEAFLRAEEETLAGLACTRTVIATGGSAVLSERAMAWLKRDSIIIFIDVPLAELEKRLCNIKTRGIALRPGQTLAGLYNERQPIYLRYADIKVPDSSASPDGGNTETLEEIVTMIIERLKAYNSKADTKGDCG